MFYSYNSIIENNIDVVKVTLKKSCGTPGIIYNIYYKISTLKVFLDVDTNDNQIILWLNDKKKYFIKNGINNIFITSDTLFDRIGLLVINPKLDNYFCIKNIIFDFENLPNYIENYKINIKFEKKNIFLINLKHRTDRLKKMEILLNSFNIEYNLFSAINGHIHTDNFNKLIDTKITSLGAYGNLLSNIEIIKKAKKNNLEYVIIFEDDLFFHKNFKRLLDNINFVPSDWKIIYLGSSQKIGTINFIEKQKYYYKANQSRGTFAYIVKCDIYDELIEIWEKKLMNGDMALEKIQNKYNCYVMWENLIIADLSNSDIQTSRDIQTYSKKFGWNLNLYLISANLTIILPVYNGEKYLYECINSILKQNYYYYQLLIINDCSTDNSMNIILSFVDERIKIINNNINLGLVETLNIGLKNVNTEYVTWISHDNYFYNNCINEMINSLQNEKNINFITAGHDKINSVGNIIKQVRPKIYNSCFDLFFYFNGIACFMFKTDIINKIGYYDKDLEGIEDWDYFIRISEIEPYKNCIIDKQLYAYRCHDEQKSKSINVIDLTYKLCNKILNKYPNINYNEYLNKTKNINIKNYINNFIFAS